jgi:predicted HicB family RNase H-like nuclease
MFNMADTHKHPHFILRIPQELKERVKEAAHKDHRSINGLICKMLEDAYPKETNYANHA